MRERERDPKSDPRLHTRSREVGGEYHSDVFSNEAQARGIALAKPIVLRGSIRRLAAIQVARLLKTLAEEWEGLMVLELVSICRAWPERAPAPRSHQDR